MDELFSRKRSENDNSILLYRILCALGYSSDAINIRQYRNAVNNLCNQCFETSKHILYHNFAGSYSEGIEGDKFVLNEINTDVDLIAVERTPEIFDTDIYSCSCFNSENDYTHFHIVDDGNYPGYVGLITNNNKRDIVVIPNTFKQRREQFDDDIMNKIVWGNDQNGPATTYSTTTDMSPWLPAGNLLQIDRTHVLFYKGWPKDADMFLTRKRPNNWPSVEAIDIIRSMGCYIVPVGHNDCRFKEVQWRISLHGEHYMFSQLNHVQVLCYVLLKWILKTELKHVAVDALSSFHVKNVIYWSVELLQCQWSPNNLLGCFKMCLGKMKTYVAQHNLPHFVFEKRNLFNSKLTTNKAKDIVGILKEFENDITKIFRLRIIRNFLKVNGCNPEDLNELSNISIIHACFRICGDVFPVFGCHIQSRVIWNQYKWYNASESLQKMETILSYLHSNLKIYFKPFIFLVESMIGLLLYALFKETGEKEYLSRAYRVSFNKFETTQRFVPYDVILLRYVMFCYMERHYDKASFICTQRIKEFYKQQNQTPDYIYQCQDDIDSLRNTADTDKVKEIVKTVFFCPDDKIKCELPATLKGKQITDAMRYLPYNLYLYKAMGVVFMTAEISAVVDFLQFELLSLSHRALLQDLHYPRPTDFFVTPLLGIVLNSNLCVMLLAFLNNTKTGRPKENTKILAHMDAYLKSKNAYENGSWMNIKRRVSFEQIYQSYNIVAYCNLKATDYQKAVRYIILSLINFPSPQNTAWGYMKCIIMVLKQI